MAKMKRLSVISGISLICVACGNLKNPTISFNHAKIRTQEFDEGNTRKGDRVIDLQVYGNKYIEKNTDFTVICSVSGKKTQWTYTDVVNPDAHRSFSSDLMKIENADRFPDGQLIPEKNSGRKVLCQLTSNNSSLTIENGFITVQYY